MADAMVESRPPLRFFCHRCRLEFQDVEQDYICPYCDGGFIEQLEGDSEGVTALASDDYSDADMSYIDYMAVDEMGQDDSDEFNTSTVHRGPMLNDLAFLMSGRQRRTPLSNNSPLYTTANITANGTANNAANGTANNAANGTANSTPSNAANGSASNAANGSANNAANGSANNAANGSANNAANGSANNAANGTTINAANATANNPPNATANNPPNRTSTAPASGNTTSIAMGPIPRGHTLMEELLWMVSGGRPTAGGVAGTPFVLVGSPGDYVLGGEGLDAVVTQLLGQLEHTGPPPLPRERLAALPASQVTEEQAAANIACSVCWENFQLGEAVTKLECEHTFHQACITPWLELHATCPVCRRSLLPPTAPSAAASSAPSAAPSTTSSTTATPPTTRPPYIQLRPPLTSFIMNTSPRIVIQRRTGALPTLNLRIPSQTHTWDSLNDTSTSGSISPASSVTAGGLWATQNRSSNSTGPTNSSTSLNSNDRDSTRQYHTDMDYD